MRPRIRTIGLACFVFLGIAWLTARAQPMAAAPASSPETGPKAGTEIANSIGAKLVYIPPGKFPMGSPKEETGRFDDEEPHEVEITRGFYLGKFEVTQEEYAKITGKNPSTFKGPNLPVETVSWNEANEYCRLLSMKEGKGGKDGKGADGYRLPTEAEWELACRAGSKTPYHFGEALTPDQANYAKTNGTVNVGKYPPNAWGLHDMHGNVWEWCQDSYAPDIHKNSLPQDPQGPLKKSTEKRVIRGGGWGSDPHYCRSAARYSQERTVSGNMGFRIALSSAR